MGYLKIAITEKVLVKKFWSFLFWVPEIPKNSWVKVIGLVNWPDPDNPSRGVWNANKVRGHYFFRLAWFLAFAVWSSSFYLWIMADLKVVTNAFFLGESKSWINFWCHFNRGTGDKSFSWQFILESLTEFQFCMEKSVKTIPDFRLLYDRLYPPSEKK